MLKKNNGITMAVLAITMAVMIIISGTIIINVTDINQVNRLSNMQTDINNLSSRISVYYATNKQLPLSTQIPSGEVKKIEGQTNVNDNDNYYQINISVLDNLSLNYGNLSQGADDMYIINEVSHQIYYLKGISYKNETYYTILDENRDLTEIDLIAPEDFAFNVEATNNSIRVVGTSASDLGISGYRFRIDNNAWTEIQVANSYTFTSLQPGQTYEISMMAVDTAGNIKMANNNKKLVTTTP